MPQESHRLIPWYPWSRCIRAHCSQTCTEIHWIDRMSVEFWKNIMRKKVIGWPSAFDIAHYTSNAFKRKHLIGVICIHESQTDAHMPAKPVIIHVYIYIHLSLYALCSSFLRNSTIIYSINYIVCLMYVYVYVNLNVHAYCNCTYVYDCLLTCVITDCWMHMYMPYCDHIAMYFIWMCIKSYEYEYESVYI